jgi:ParB family chromosome partitioning protein
MRENGRSRETHEPGARQDVCPPWRLVRRRLAELKVPSDSPRGEDVDVGSLARSVARHGLLVPILIEPDGTVRAGSRRLTAVRKLGRKEVECLLLPPGADPSVVQLVENIQRKGLSPIEEAQAFKTLLDRTGWTQARLAGELGVPASRISLALNLLEAPPDVRNAVAEGRMSAYAVKTAFGKKSRLSGRAEQVAERIRSGKNVRPHFAPPSLRVSVRDLPCSVRARVFYDRAEVTFTLKDDSPGLDSITSLAVSVAACIGDSEGAVLRALRRTRKKLLETEEGVDAKTG